MHYGGCGDFGLLDLRIDFVDGSILPLETIVGVPSVDVSKPLAKIVTTITQDEYFTYSIEWFFRDGSYQRMGKGKPKYAGRSQTIEFANGEILIGARFHHNRHGLYIGIEWITGRYAQ